MHDDWAAGNVDSDGDGATNAKEFLAGTNPLDPNSVLKMRFTWNRFGRILNWNTQPGLVYQVQVSTDLVNWSSLSATTATSSLGTEVLDPDAYKFPVRYYRARQSGPAQ